MTIKEKFKYFFKWTKSVLLEAFEQLQKKYQELEKQNKEQREEIIRLKAELEKIKIKSINLEGNKPSSKKPEWDKKGVGNDGKGNKNKGKGRGSKARKGAGNSRKDKKKLPEQSRLPSINVIIAIAI
jgi:hypothetical protein